MGPYAFLVEMVLVFGSVLAFAVYELVKTRRALRRDREAAERAEAGGPPGPSGPSAP